MVCGTLKSMYNCIVHYKIAMCDLKIYQLKMDKKKFSMDFPKKEKKIQNGIPNVMKLVRDSTVIGPLPQKYVPRSKI